MKAPSTHKFGTFDINIFDGSISSSRITIFYFMNKRKHSYLQGRATLNPCLATLYLITNHTLIKCKVDGLNLIDKHFIWVCNLSHTQLHHIKAKVGIQNQTVKTLSFIITYLSLKSLYNDVNNYTRTFKLCHLIFFCVRR